MEREVFSKLDILELTLFPLDSPCISHSFVTNSSRVFETHCKQAGRLLTHKQRKPLFMEYVHYRFGRSLWVDLDRPQ